MNAIEVTLSLPDRRLSPNARVHWRTKSAVYKRHRESARILSWEQAPSRRPSLILNARAILVFHWPDRRRRDKDNALASCKAYLDGIADAGIVDDDNRFDDFKIEFKVDKANPRLVIRVEGI